MTEPLKLPIAQGVTIETRKDDAMTALFFKIADDPGYVGVALRNQELSRIVALILSQAADVAATVTPKTPPETMTSMPVMASHLAFGKGRSDAEAFVAFRIGNIDLTFAVDVSMLHEQCTRLLSMTRVTEPRKLQ